MAAEPFDVVIVGSGAAGGMAAYALTRAGVKVCMLEAGRAYDPTVETPMLNSNFEAPLRGVDTPDKPFGFYDATVGGGWDVPGEPYSIAEGSEFRWYRARMLGGRTNHWGRVSLRFAEHDLKARSRDGLGVDWPISYAELSPYYDKAERLVGIVGTKDGLDDAPDSPPGILHEPPAPRAHELLIKRGAEGLGRPVVPNRAAVITRPIDGRSACIYSTPCARGCSIKANFQSTTVMLPPALATGNLKIVTNAMAYEVEVDKAGKARGVHYVDTKTGRHLFVAGKAVMLGASAMESARILLNSKSNRFPNGLANGSGLVGRYIMDSVGSAGWAQFPALEKLPPHDDFGISLPHLYIPWWGLKDQMAGRLDFPRGYHFEFNGGRREPGAKTFDQLKRVTPGSYGSRLKEDARRYYASFVYFMHRGEMIPNRSSSMDIDPLVKDRWGIPVPRFRFGWSDHERRQTRHAQQSMKEIVEASGGRIISPPGAPETGISKGGEIIHEVGGVRMGASPGESVLNGFCQSWEVPNLYVIDGGAFASNPHKNPTLTIIALAWRASDHLRAVTSKNG